MKIIGLTGGIASGKSTVSQRLAQLGAVVIDGDRIAHRTMEPGRPAHREIVQEFGPAILSPDGTIDRGRLGAIVFSDPARMRVLNRIVRPYIYEAIDGEMKREQLAHPEGVMVLDIPLLFESRLDQVCDQVWVVWVDRETQINRLMTRNSLSREEAISRIDSQMSLDEKARRAHIVIDNSGGIDDTLRLAAKYYRDIVGGGPI